MDDKKDTTPAPQHLERAYSTDSSQAEVGKIIKKRPARNTIDAELAMVLEKVRLGAGRSDSVALQTRRD